MLLDHDVLIDAGTGVGDLSVAELTRIDHIFVTHSHMDHVVSIPFLADTVRRPKHSRRCASTCSTGSCGRTSRRFRIRQSPSCVTSTSRSAYR
jgi:ribonuclease BN (tRNA processing enzyme)